MVYASIKLLIRIFACNRLTNGNMFHGKIYSIITADVNGNSFINVRSFINMRERVNVKKGCRDTLKSTVDCKGNKRFIIFSI